MAVDKLWLGTNEDNEGIWDIAANWSPSGIPAAPDTAFLVTGNQDVTGAAVATDIARIVVGPQYTGFIGSSTTALDIDVDDLDYAGGGGGAYFKGEHTNVTVQDTGVGTAALTFDDATITTLRIQGGKGTITLDAGCTILTGGVIDQIGADNVTLVIEAATIHTSVVLTMDSGIVEMSVAVPNITVYGGELRSLLASDVTAVTLLEQYGGKVRWRPTASCTLTTLTLFTGLFDSRDSTAPTFTITNTTVHQNGLIDERSGLQNAVYTYPLVMEGGEVRYDAGRTITIS